MEPCVILEHWTPMRVAAEAAWTCTDNDGRARKDHEDLDILLRCLRRGHESVLEHIVFTFKLEGFSRAMLQELSRHRIASLSVMSTRWCLRRLLSKEDHFDVDSDEDLKRALKYLVPTGSEDVDYNNVMQLNAMIAASKDGVLSDELKYMIPEAFRTKCYLTINLRSLRNLLELRTSPRALEEFRDFACMMATAIQVTADDRHFWLIEDVGDCAEED